MVWRGLSDYVISSGRATEIRTEDARFSPQGRTQHRRPSGRLYFFPEPAIDESTSGVLHLDMPLPCGFFAKPAFEKNLNLLFPGP